MNDQPLAGTRVLILGASGFFGAWVCRAAELAGADVHAIARNVGNLQSLKRRSPAAVLSIGDLGTPGVARDLIDRLRPSVVINLIGYGVDREERDAALARRLNAELAEEVGEAVLAAEPTLPKGAGLRLLHLGSAFEYGSVEGLVSETTSCTPQSVYAETKLDGTRRLERLRQAGLAGLVVRVATVYGAGEHPHRLLPTLIRAARTGEQVSLTAGEQQRDFTYVADVAEGLVRLIARGAPPWGVANLATGRLCEVRTFIGCAREMLGLRPDQVALGAIPYRSDEVWQGPIDTGRLDGWLSWRPATSIEAGIQATIAEP